MKNLLFIATILIMVGCKETPFDPAKTIEYKIEAEAESIGLAIEAQSLKKILFVGDTLHFFVYPGYPVRITNMGNAVPDGRNYKWVPAAGTAIVNGDTLYIEEKQVLTYNVESSAVQSN